MKITDFQIKKYDLPLVKPLIIRGKTICSRSGVIILLRNSDAFVGCGETAPLPGLHKENLTQVISQLNGLKEEILGLEINATPFAFDGQLQNLFSTDLFASVRFGIEMAIFNLLRQSQNISINPQITAIDVNGLITAEDDLFVEVENLLKRGYSTIKIKVGRRSIEEDIKMVRTLKEIIGGRAGLRLDANRSWLLAEAISFCKAIGPMGIEYIEEPLKNIADLGCFFNETNMPVALDETIVESGIDTTEDFNTIVAFVLKPSLLGGFDKTAQIVKFAKKNHKNVCLSSTFETSVSIEAFAAFAALMKIDDTPHGLDTLKWFEEDLFINPLNVSNGEMNVSQLPPGPDNLRMDLLKDVSNI